MQFFIVMWSFCGSVAKAYEGGWLICTYGPGDYYYYGDSKIHKWLSLPYFCEFY